MTRSPYPTDLTDEQWTILSPLIPPPHRKARPRQAAMREVFNGMMYVLRTGCPWRHLPHDLPPYRTVFYYFTKWRKCGLWRKLHDKLHERVRVEQGRSPTPSAVAASAIRSASTRKRTSSRSFR